MKIKLINRKKLLRYWIFYNGILSYTFKSNYELLNILAGNNCFIKFKVLILNFKKIIPIILNITDLKFLLVGVTHIFSKNLTKLEKFSQITEIEKIKLGTFCNVHIMSKSIFKNICFEKNPNFVLFWNGDQNTYLIEESKKKIIPSIGLINTSTNALLIDYQITVNNNYFYSVYFFTKLLFKMLSLKK